MRTITIAGTTYQHISTLDEKRDTVQKRLHRNVTQSNQPKIFDAIDPKTGRTAVKIDGGWWVQVPPSNIKKKINYEKH